MEFYDATGAAVVLPAPPRRIVSLIPSITEMLFALGAGPAVTGCTVYCTEPAEGVATKTRVGGEKNPKLDLIRELGADLVVANVEENVREHVETLRGWGIPVYVTYPHTVADGIRLVRDLGELVGQGEREVTLDEVARAAPEVILLPDEPYRFRGAHLADFQAHPEIPAVRDGRLHLVDGKLATWYGPRIKDALAILPRLIGGESAP